MEPLTHHTEPHIKEKPQNAKYILMDKVHIVIDPLRLKKKQAVQEQSSTKKERTGRTKDTVQTKADGKFVAVHSHSLSMARDLHSKACINLFSATKTRNAIVPNGLVAQAIMGWPKLKRKESANAH